MTDFDRLYLIAIVTGLEHIICKGVADVPFDVRAQWIRDYVEPLDVIETEKLRLLTAGYHGFGRAIRLAEELFNGELGIKQ